MRIAMTGETPGRTFNGMYNIWLNGVIVDEVVTADVAKGYVVALKRDENGKLIPNGGAMTTEKLYGVVTIEELTR